MLQKEQDKMKAKFISFESAPVPKISEVPSTPSVRSHLLKKRPNTDDLAGDGPSSSKNKKFAPVGEVDSVSNMAGARASQWKSFWVPELSTNAEPDRIEKPVIPIFARRKFMPNLVK